MMVVCGVGDGYGRWLVWDGRCRGERRWLACFDGLVGLLRLKIHSLA